MGGRGSPLGTVRRAPDHAHRTTTRIGDDAPFLLPAASLEVLPLLLRPCILSLGVRQRELEVVASCVELGALVIIGKLIARSKNLRLLSLFILLHFWNKLGEHNNFDV
jgi:hypothetical protein